MAMYEGAVANALRGGRFLDAASRLKDQERRDVNLEVLELETFYFLGRSVFVRENGGRMLERSDLTPGQFARCLFIVASQCWDDGQVKDAIPQLVRSIEAAEKASDAVAVCRATAKLLECTCDNVAFHASLPLAMQARRAATHCGDPHALVSVHVTLGRLEARAGRFQTAMRHFQTSRRLLSDDPNLFWSASLHIGESTLCGLSGDPRRALELAATAAALAEESGWTKGIVAARINAAHLLDQLDRPAEAEKQLLLADAQGYDGINYEIAKAEERAQLAVRAGRYEAAQEILDRLDAAKVFGSTWYRASVQSARVQLLLTQKRWNEAIGQSDKHIKTACDAGLRAHEASMLLQKAAALLGSGNTLETIRLPFSVDIYPSSLPVLQSLWIVLARAFSASGDLGRASGYQSRARRLLLTTGTKAVVGGEETAYPAAPSGPIPDLDAAVWLFDLAAYPHAFAAEAFAIIGQSGCADAVALIARRKGDVRVIEKLGWDEKETPASPTNGGQLVAVKIGEHGDESLEILVQPRRELKHSCTLSAIRKLVEAAAELDRYRRAEKQRAALWPVESMDQEGDTIWVSEQMSEVLKIARRIAPTPLSVLLTGETGTGKELLAREIHRASDRAERPFLPFNCTAVPRDMLESQLFGYRKGAFTGADASFAGVIRSAAGGTLFLDEIADVPLDVQPKLLRFLETREIHPLGEPQPITVDVRIVAATNANLEQLVAEGRFREDLFYRLNVVRLKLPPLRERREEIPALAQHYVRKFSDEQKKGQLTLADETLEYLLLYSWPGNVRQLANEVRRMVVMAEPDSALTPPLLSPELQASRRTMPASAPPPPAEPEIRLRLDQPLPLAVEILEQTMIRSALTRSRGRVEEAARLLGISRKGLFLKRRRWNLDQKQAS